MAKKRKKILILGPDLSVPGGVKNYYTTLNLISFDYIHYFVINKKISDNPVFIYTRLTKVYFQFLFKMIFANYNTVVINPSLIRKSFYRDIYFILVSKLFNKNTFIFFRGWSVNWEEKIKKSKFKSFLFKISYAKADKYIVLGAFFKDKCYELGVPESSPFVIVTTVADSSYLQSLDLDLKFLNFRKEMNILFLARMIKEKGIYVAINAFELFLKNNPERKANLFIAGDGQELLSVKKFVLKKQLPNVFILGNVSGLKKKKVLIDCHVLLFPSYSGEGLPNTMLECMLYGMAIIGSSVGGIPEIIKQGENGFLVDTFNPEIYSKYLNIISSNEQLYKTLSKTNHNQALNNYTTEKVKERILNILND